jgi:hypothetical protein
MPFTISHAAAAVPFSRFGLNLPALIVGSMIPDFIYFVGLKESRHLTHSLPGLFVCLAAGLIALWIYEKSVKAPLLSLMPRRLRIKAASSPVEFRPARKLLILALSVLVGAATHLVWDSFTHEKGWAADNLPLLQMTAIDFGFDKMPLSRLLHHAGSLAGLGFIAFWIRRLYVNGKRQASCMPLKRISRARLRAVAASASCIVFGLLLSWMQVGPVATFDHLRLMIVDSIFFSGSALLSFTFSYSALWHLQRKGIGRGNKRRRRRKSGQELNREEHSGFN